VRSNERQSRMRRMASQKPKEDPVMRKSITHVGLDVHKETITGAVLPSDEEKVVERKTLPTNTGRLLKWLRRVERQWGGELRVCYEASSAGYVLYRELCSRGIHCEVVAPSLIPRKPGESRKTDGIDAEHLAFQYRNGSLTMVVVPEREDEALRAVVRLRGALMRELKRAKQQLLSHLGRNGCEYSGKSNWTKGHFDWLGRLRLPVEDEEFVLRRCVERIEVLQAQVRELDERIQTRSASKRYEARVARVTCLKGFAVLSGTSMVVEVGDFTRFPTSGHFMSYMGLVPGVWESGGTRKNAVKITKAGNAECRRLLTEAAWNVVRHAPQAGRDLRDRWEGQPAWVVQHSQKAMKRLHSRYWQLMHRGKSKQEAITAVARELAGFLWAIMQSEDVANCRGAA
jgi:transposase